MDQGKFRELLDSFTEAVQNGNGEALASLFTPQGSYEDGFYGQFIGRNAIQDMLQNHFWGHAHSFTWEMLDPVIQDQVGYASYLFSYTSKLPEAMGQRVIFEGMSKFELERDKIQHYSEIFNTGIALVQLSFHPERIHKHLAKKADSLRAKVSIDS